MSRSTSVIPGFGLTLGYTLVYLSLLVLIPLGTLFLKTTELSWAQFIAIVSAPRVLAALKLSFGTAFVAAVLNGIIGTLLAWVLPAWLTGFALTFARGVGEYGSVIFIAGNMPMKTEILPLLIMVKLDQYDYAGATAIGVLMLVVSFVLLLFINLLQRRIAHS